MRLIRSLMGTLGVVLLAACSSTTSPATGGNNNNNPGSGNQSGGHTQDISVTGGSSFSPAVDTVAANTTVTWTWPSGGGVSHNVTFQDGPASPTQDTGTYQRTFSTPGTYQYRCTIHSSNFSSGMVGTIVVQ
jgi:plastocyanin